MLKIHVCFLHLSKLSMITDFSIVRFKKSVKQAHNLLRLYPLYTYKIFTYFHMQ